MPNIEPLYIAILIAIVIGVVWYIQHKKESDAKNKGESILGKVKDKHDRDDLPDIVSVDEEQVPRLTAEDEDPSAAANAASSGATQEVDKPMAPPVAQSEEPIAVSMESKEAPRVPVAQRRKAEVDPAVEAVINITPLEGSFDLRALKQRIADIEAEPLLKDLVRVQCFDKVSGLWYDGADRLTECTQIYLSMLLANRSRRVDQPTASKFMIHAEQFAIELKGESETPDSNEMIQGAERIQRIHLLAHRTVQAGIPRVQAHSILSLRFRCLHLRQDLLQCHLRAVVNLYPRPRVFQQGRVHQAARVDHHVRALQQRRPPQRDQIRRAGAGTHKMHHVRFLLSCL